LNICELDNVQNVSKSPCTRYKCFYVSVGKRREELKNRK